MYSFLGLFYAINKSMWVKNIITTKDVPLTVDFRAGVTINGYTFTGTFDWYQILWVSAGVLWFDSDRATPITTVGEDNCYPIGTYGWVRTPDKEFSNQLAWRKLGTLQVLPPNDGWLSIVIWTSQDDFKHRVKKI